MRAFARFYGAHPLHLLTMGFAFALVGYVVHVAGIQTFWNRDVWWQSIGVWFVGAVLVHDLLLFPLYALADRSLKTGLIAVRGRVPQLQASISPLNYIRVPALGTALTFALFFLGEYANMILMAAMPTPPPSCTSSPAQTSWPPDSWTMSAR